MTMPSVGIMKARTILAASTAVLVLVVGGCASLEAEPRATATAAIPLWKDYADKPEGYLTAGEAPVSQAYLRPPPSDGSPTASADLAIYRATRALRAAPGGREPKATLMARRRRLSTRRSVVR